MENTEKFNPTFQRQEDIIAKVKSSGQSFIFDAEDEITDDYAHFYFLGVHGGKEVLFDTVLYTLRMQHESELFEIAISAQQERSILCDSDTNVILLAHRFYGLLIDDSTIQRVMDNNSIGLSEILDIKKGRKILYYV